MADAVKFEPGIHFGLDEEVYHATPALSSSGVKNIRMSPLDFWARATWLNPNYEDDNEETGDSFAKVLGRAYHKRILEGQEAFGWCYAPSFDKALHKDALDGADAIKDALRKHKEQGATVKLTGKKDELIQQLLALDPAVRILDVIEESYVAEHPGKTFLPQKYLDKIELSAAMIERDPELRKAFTGGMAEVSVFWVCEKTGAECKARLDYLKPRAIVDLKTFANKSGYPIGRAIERELGYNRYPIQGAWYYDAADHVAGLIKAGLVRGEVAKPFVDALAADHPKTFVYIFQQKGVAPLARGRSFPRASSNCLVAQAGCEAAKQTYRECLETFGNDPWLTSEPISDFDDARIPALWE